MIRKDKEEELFARMKRLGIREEDLIEKFILGSGRGGQKINKTSSCVYLKHSPTGIEVKCQKSRYREMNRFISRRALCDRLEEQQGQIKTERQKAIEKIRRQKKRRSRRSKEKMLEGKRVRSKKKSLRKSPKQDDSLR